MAGMDFTSILAGEFVFDPESPKAVRAAELARELLTARAAAEPGPGGASQLSETLSRVVVEIAPDGEMLCYLLMAQVFLTYGAACSMAYTALNGEVDDEDRLSEAVGAAIRGLIITSASHGWTTG